MGFLAGKRVLVTGVLSNRSIAYGIAQACKREGAELAFTYVGERFRERIAEVAKQFGSDLIYDMDVSDDAQIAATFDALKQRWDGLDGLVHSIGFAPRDAIAGDFVEGLSRESFRIAHDISSYSFPALAKAALPLMEGRKAALLTLTYLVRRARCRTTTRWGWRRRVWKPACAIWRQGLDRAEFASTGFLRGRLGHLPLRVSRASRKFCRRWRPHRRCGAT